MTSSEAQIEMISLLKAGYAAEIETAMNYLAHSINIVGIQGHIVREVLADEAKEEMGHATKIGQRLRVLGVIVPGSNFLRTEMISTGQMALQPPADGSELQTILEGICLAEKEAIALYNRIIELSIELNDHATGDMAIQLLADEEQHLNLFKGFLSTCLCPCP